MPKKFLGDVIKKLNKNYFLYNILYKHEKALYMKKKNRLSYTK